MRSILSVLSPHKFHAVLYLIKKHEALGDKILVFVDNKFEIQEYLIISPVIVNKEWLILIYASRLNRSYVSGDTEKLYRESIFQKFLVFKKKNKGKVFTFSFQTGNTVNTILITRTGDESLNLPIANVVIQTSFHHGANNQEAQRLGRWKK